MDSQVPSFCNHCNEEVSPDHWWWMKDSRYRLGGKWRCRQAKSQAGRRYRERVNTNQEKLKSKRQYHSEYHRKHRHIAKYKAYVHADKKAQRIGTLSRTEAFALMQLPCHYCSLRPAEGIDRKDSQLGHTPANSVACCEKCNNILGDIPYEAKRLLKPGLTAIQEQQLLSDWCIPTKRIRDGVSP